MKKYSFNKYVELWGKTPQVLTAVEEMSELTKELLKDVNRKKDNREDIVEEFADVTIMLEQLKVIYNITDEELEGQIEKKIEKMEKRITKDIK